MCPARANTMAALRPLGPEPMTTARLPAMEHQESAEFGGRPEVAVEVNTLLVAGALEADDGARRRSVRVHISGRRIGDTGMFEPGAGQQGLEWVFELVLVDVEADRLAAGALNQGRRREVRGAIVPLPHVVEVSFLARPGGSGERARPVLEQRQAGAP